MKTEYAHFPFPLIALDQTDSTNRYLNQLCADMPDGVEEFTTVTAEYQTAGKGQRGNSWESERGKNLLFSFVLYPTFLKANRQFVLSQIVALSVKDVLQSVAKGFSVKWPNDIYWEERKIGGILIEHDLQDTRIARSTIGIGVNINQEYFVSDAPNPVSLKQITGYDYQRGMCLSDFMERMQLHYSNLKADVDGYSLVVDRCYNDGLFRRNVWYRYADSDGVFEACLLRAEPDGRLVLQDKEGQLRRYWFKEVSYVL